MRFFPDVPIDVPVPVLHADTQTAAVVAAVRVLTDVWKNEETRFSNLNTRAVALLSATSVVVSLIGLFFRNLLDASLKDIGRTIGIAGAGSALLFLVLAAGMITLGVLRPARRTIFGDNPLTAGEAALTEDSIARVAFAEFGGLYAKLADRSAWKAVWLTYAYYSFFIGIFLSAATTIFVAINKA